MLPSAQLVEGFSSIIQGLSMNHIEPERNCNVNATYI
jgi:hypothetical protein